jgi:hypothetical protein
MKAPEGEVVVQKFRAHGVQIYACVGTGGDAGGVAWEHQAPETDLTDDTGQRVGRHYAGPTWESTDGSKVVGELVKKVPAADGRGVHWLLMRAKATLGTGIFSKVTSIQRVDTVGGKPPTQGCDSTTLGNTERVPYEGTYYFYARP